MIEIWLDGSQPPSGRVVSSRAEPERFDGWLQLLHILAEVIARGPEVIMREPASGPEPDVP